MNFSPEKCPLCGESNGCQLASSGCYKGECWCMKENIPAELLANVPEDARRVACVCKKCVVIARTAEARKKPVPRTQAGDFYIEEDHVVFTAQYHLRRGYCCGSGCRHCPFDGLERELAFGANADSERR
ncbi:MAG: cysteine-rich CWC family protein [Chthoniobacteraceae bacterium]